MFPGDCPVRLLIARPNMKGLQDSEMRSHAAENDVHNLSEYEAEVVLQDQSGSFLISLLVINVITATLYSVESMVAQPQSKLATCTLAPVL